MIREKNYFWLVTFSVLIIAVGLLIGVFIQRPTPEASDQYRKLVEKLLDEVAPSVEELRGLTLPEGFEFKDVTAQWVRENWGTRYFEAISEEVEDEERIYKSLFLIPEGFSLKEAYVGISSMTMAAVLDNTLYVVREYFNPLDNESKRTLVHELTHIMQGEHFRVPEVSTFDEKQAWNALIEGDSDLTASVYIETMRSHLTWRRPVSIMNLDSAVAEDIASHNGGLSSVRRLRMFPYKYGKDFVEALYQRGGFDEVNNAYLNPPQSTEQVMHHNKYVLGERATSVKMPGLGLEGWDLERTDRLGEYFILVMLDTWLPDTFAQRVAEDWEGDNLTYYERGEDWLLTWGVKWDSEVDALEFHESFTEVLMRVGGQASERRDVNRIWKVSWGYVLISVKSNETFIAGSTDREALFEAYKIKVAH
ncbi:MAG: hypothetical protein GTN80_08080 [Nitrososphaeria archaeon]|nr:hypothetical protein [Nitrososphaeria archaeon]NIN53021.1 hypothetical protein [Nitrososphaeria archaeon]NIQ33580.1 hypothetical protein [Nitrososphaeria archaeon]